MRDQQSLYLPRARGEKGFTLLELMVATTLTVVISVIVVTVTTSFLRGWNESTGAFSHEAEVNRALEKMRDDFAAAVVPMNDRPWLWIEAGEMGEISLRWYRPSDDTTVTGGLELVEWTVAQRDHLGRRGTLQSCFRASMEGAPGRGLADRLTRTFTPADWWNAFYFTHVVRSRIELWVVDENGREQPLIAGGVLDLSPGAPPIVFPVVAGPAFYRAPARIEWRLNVLDGNGISDPRPTRPASTVGAESGRTFVAHLKPIGGRL